MTKARNECVENAASAGTGYTVISKGGQRGTVFRDPRLAALAFLRASDLDRPFIMRHRGATTSVIASVRSGSKRM
jgi:hypothetical protein